MAGNGGRSRRAHGACGCATEAVISASPGILSAESEFHYRAAVRYYRILLKTVSFGRERRGPSFARLHKAEPYAAGACQPPNSRSKRRATASAISSLQGATAICTPMGRPAAETPQRTTAAGHPDTLCAMVWLNPWKFWSRIDAP